VNSLAPVWLQHSAARSARTNEEGAWASLGRGVMRRPGLVALATGAVLLAIASPALRLQLIPADAHVLPASSQSRQIAETLSKDFASDGSQTISIVVPASADSGTSVDALALRARQTAAGQASEAVPPRYLGRGTWEIELLPRGSDASVANQQLVRRLRVLARAGGTPNALVGGTTAWFIDQKAAISAQLPLALAILVCVTLGTLFLMTGSVVLPLMALLMNILTVAVGAGLLVLIFQDGHFSSLMGFSPIGGLEESNLVLLFTVAFALSTDYGVFLFARIKEAHDGGLGTREAVVQGLERTGRLITAAALLFCVAVGAFVTSHIFFIKQFGVGTALAVAIDATFVRALLVPALMGKLGERTWWAPGPLRRLHTQIGLHEELAEPAGA
jgi:RND superfamily putative drug exporter